MLNVFVGCQGEHDLETKQLNMFTSLLLENNLEHLQT